jgi:hypothetical protein
MLHHHNTSPHSHAPQCCITTTPHHSHAPQCCTTRTPHHTVTHPTVAPPQHLTTQSRTPMLHHNNTSPHSHAPQCCRTTPPHHNCASNMTRNSALHLSKVKFVFPSVPHICHFQSGFFTKLCLFVCFQTVSSCTHLPHLHSPHKY